MAANKESRHVQNPAMLAVGARNDVLVWRQQVGMFRQYEHPYAPIRIGLPGMSDSMMIVSVIITEEMVGKRIGVAVCAEFKQGKGKQSEQQKRWQDAVEMRGGIYQVVRSADEMVSLVQRVQCGYW